VVDCEPVVTAGSDDLFVFWNPTALSSDNHVYFKKWTSLDGWSSSYDWFSDSSIKDRNSISAIEDGSAGNVQLIYMQGSSPYSIKFQKMSFSETVSPFTIYNTGYDYPITSGVWSDVDLLLTFSSLGGITVDVGSYGQPNTIWDGENFLAWSMSGNNISFTATGSSIEMSWAYTSESETRGTGGDDVEEEVIEVFEPVGVDWASWGLFGLIAGMAVVTVAGIASASTKKKVSRKATGKTMKVKIQPSGKGTTKTIKVKGSSAYGGIKPKGVKRRKNKWD